MKILGMDIGQNKSAWETLDTQTGEITNGWVAMDADALQKLLHRTRPDQFVIESGPPAARVHDLARDLEPLYARAGAAVCSNASAFRPEMPARTSPRLKWAS